MAEAGGLVAAGGSVLKGVGAYQAGKYNRAAAREEALAAERDGAAEALRIRAAARAAMGDQLAAQAENGFAVGTGSALDALRESAINSTLDAITVRRQAMARARSARASGDIAYAQGKNSLVSSLVGAGASTVDWASSRQGSSPARGAG